ncbi:hypothetical protein [Moorena producens]|uniref:hypothetical protein n=1 Tax=Moorena producens TaxID=1155739 RepID=UPI003C77D3E4
MYSQKWVSFMGKSWDLVDDVMPLSHHKLDNYLQNMRAMKLIIIQSLFSSRVAPPGKIRQPTIVG